VPYLLNSGDIQVEQTASQTDACTDSQIHTWTTWLLNASTT